MVGGLGAHLAGRRVRPRSRHVPGYQRYWTAIQNEPDEPVWSTRSAPTPTEIDWARFAARTPHYVLSSTLSSALWPKTTFVRTLGEIAALKRRPGKDIYLIGGLEPRRALSMPLLRLGRLDPRECRSRATVPRRL
jgi:hypothetical protein